MRIMAIDYGDAHTGLAVSDATGLVAGHVEVVNSRREADVLSAAQSLAEEYGVEEIVLGYPKNMDGSLGPRAEKAERFAQALREAFTIPVALWDERRTTIAAHNILFSAGKNGRKRKKIVDGVAAALILEGYLAYKRGR